MDKAKLIIAAVVAAILIILILQNSEDVEIRILFATVIMPRAVLIVITALFGFVIGVLMAMVYSRKDRSKNPGKPPGPVTDARG
jgi:uncharacterized integral membrane protein